MWSVKTARKFWHTEGFRESNWTLSAVGTDRISLPAPSVRVTADGDCFTSKSGPSHWQRSRAGSGKYLFHSKKRKKWNVFLTLKILLILSINFSYSRIIKDVNSVFKKMPNTEYLVWSGFEAFLAFSRLSGNPEESKRDAFWRQTFIKNLYWLITTAMKRCSYLKSPTRSLFIVTDQLHFTFLCSYS